MRRSLGRGLTQLLSETTTDTKPVAPSATSEANYNLNIADIVVNKRQPRSKFDDESLDELAASIKVHGVLTPILVRPIGKGKYEIIAGERRFRASKLAGLQNIPAVVRIADGSTSLELAIIENVQREDLTAYETALAYRALTDEFGLDQGEIAAKVGKSRVAISNTMRLLKLPEVILEGLQAGILSEGHARALLSLPTTQLQLRAFELIKSNGLSVRQVEALSKASDSASKVTKPRESKDIYTKQLENAISEKLGATSTLQRTGSGGKLLVSFYDEDDLTRILDVLGVLL